MTSNGHGYCDGHNAMDDVVQNGMMMKWWKQYLHEVAMQLKKQMATMQMVGEVITATMVMHKMME